MSRTVLAAVLLSAFGAVTAESNVPDPSRSSIVLSGAGTACHYRFRADGGLDCLTVLITMRGAFDDPSANCSTTVTLAEEAGTLSFCTCCPNPATGRTDLDGVFQADFCQLGGRGTLDVCVSAHCQGNIGLGCPSIEFTSPDLAADCAPVNVISMGIWAGCLPPGPYCPASDYNCDGTVDVLDLALWAGALGVGCGACP